MGYSVFPAAGGGVTQKVQQFLSTGTFTVPSNCSAVQLLLVGGGGGGGAAKSTNTAVLSSGGGGGGEVIDTFVSVTPGASYTVTIGAGGAGSSNIASAGGTGGSTSFGGLASANGGGGGAGIPNNFSGFTSPNTNGGYGGGSSTYSSGGGGGAGGHAISLGAVVAGTSMTPWTSPTVQSNNTRLGGMGAQGTTSTSQAVFYAGIGKYGFGNGGAGGQTSNNSYGGNATGMSLSAGTSRSEIYFENNAAHQAGTNASANSGDGGGGAITTGSGAQTRTGLNGGSGYARVIYWS